jgi:hypothetical protein
MRLLFLMPNGTAAERWADENSFPMVRPLRLRVPLPQAATPGDNGTFQTAVHLWPLTITISVRNPRCHLNLAVQRFQEVVDKKSQEENLPTVVYSERNKLSFLINPRKQSPRY